MRKTIPITSTILILMLILSVAITGAQEEATPEAAPLYLQVEDPYPNLTIFEASLNTSWEPPFDAFLVEHQEIEAASTLFTALDEMNSGERDTIVLERLAFYYGFISRTINSDGTVEFENLDECICSDENIFAMAGHRYWGYQLLTSKFEGDLLTVQFFEDDQEAMREVLPHWVLQYVLFYADGQWHVKRGEHLNVANTGFSEIGDTVILLQLDRATSALAELSYFQAFSLGGE